MAAAYHLRQQGYIAVYLPFAFSDLKDISSTSSSSQGSKLCKQLTLAGLSKKPGSAGSSSLTATWKSRLSQQSTNAGDVAAEGSQQCLTLLPNTTTLDRYLWSVQWFLANGLYVILSSASPGDSSSNAACAAASSSSSGSVGCTQDAGASADAWVRLWKAVVALPAFEGSVKGRVMLQLAQDPSSSGPVWESTTSSSGQKQPGEHEWACSYPAGPNACIVDVWSPYDCTYPLTLQAAAAAVSAEPRKAHNLLPQCRAYMLHASWNASSTCQSFSSAASTKG